MEMYNDEILQRFPNTLQRVIKHLWLDGKIGIACLNPKIVKYDPYDAPKRNRFIMEVPYAGRHLNWEVIFNDEDLSFAPDFDFLNDQFLINPDIDVIENEVPSLAAWDVEDSHALVSVIREFIVLYKKYQLEKLQEAKYQRQSIEYNLLTGGPQGLDSEGIEVYIDSQDYVHFLITINIDASEFPPYLQPNDETNIINPGEDAASLKVSFQTSRVYTWLQLSPRLESVIGPSNHLHIPTYSKDSGLIEYVPAVTELIKSKLNQVTRSHELRKEYISTLLARQGGSVLEYDCLMFMKMTMLLEVVDSYALVSITLSKKFPHECPVVRLTSTIHDKNGVPVMKEYTKYQHDPTSSPSTMVNNVLKFLKTAISQFDRVQAAEREL